MFGSHFKQVSKVGDLCWRQAASMLMICRLFEMSFGLRESIEWLYRTSYSQCTLMNPKMAQEDWEFCSNEKSKTASLWDPKVFSNYLTVNNKRESFYVTKLDELLSSCLCKLLSTLSCHVATNAILPRIFIWKLQRFLLLKLIRLFIQ